MKCSKCDDPAAHAIQIRIGDLPNGFDAKMKDKDKSGVYIFRFCTTHWRELRKCLPF